MHVYSRNSSRDNLHNWLAVFHPHRPVIDKWVDRRPVRRDSVGAPFYEGGYAVSVIILLVAALESYVARDRFFSQKQPRRRHATVPEYMAEVYRYRGLARLSELFVVRNAIIHSHVWVLRFALRKTGGRRFISASRTGWSGNEKLELHLNLKTHRTKRLRFNAIPSRMDRTDVIKAFDIVVAAFRFLEKRGANPLPIFPFDVRHQGQRISFDKLSECLAAVPELPTNEE